MALKAWAENATPGWGLEEKIQALDQVLGGAWMLSEPGGRYARVVKRFERWLESARAIMEARELQAQHRGSTDGDAAAESMFISPLDLEWKSELRALSRKLEQWRNQLLSFGDAPASSTSSSLSQESSLALILRGVRDLVNGMGEEMLAMEGLERSVVAREECWIREAIEGDDDDDDYGKGDEGRVAGAVWRMG